MVYSRHVVNFNKIFDILNDARDNKFITFGYIQTINTSLPKIKRRNPATNRMKGYTDYSRFSGENENEIATIIKFTIYNLRYRKPSIVNAEYGDYKRSLDDINIRYGLQPTGMRDSFRDTLNYGANGVEVYKGDNTSKSQNTYFVQNMKTVKVLDRYFYALDADGNRIKEIPEDDIKDFLIKNTNLGSVSQLRKLNVEEEKVRQYIEEVNNLNMIFRQYIHNKIVWVAAKIGDEKLLAVNHNLSLGDVKIKKKAFFDIIQTRYNKEIDPQELKTLADSIAEKYKVNTNNKALYETRTNNSWYTPRGTEFYNTSIKLKKVATERFKVSWKFTDNNGYKAYDMNVNDKEVLKEIKKLNNRQINCEISSRDRDNTGIWHYFLTLAFSVKYDENMNIVNYRLTFDPGPHALLDTEDFIKTITKILDNYIFFKRYIKKSSSWIKILNEIRYEMK